ncbi:ABC transporter permease [Ornithinimicrobium sp. F0845]|uniref:ABC transporter permease n=1 Tax=Ornithinimicrobium sp. F0845 TaxID=2926412 RepID=UPI001FF3594B|nr:ABC transporter permease [Ornithinimicrobium sp. F0845]MCK0112079.1 ABC transporter permease [Ornithinimicrobium sp. F0845]
MSTTTELQATPQAAPARAGFHLPTIQDNPITAVPFSRLVRVETRKQVDTLAGRWFLIILGLVIVVAMTIMLFVDQGDHSYGNYLAAAGIPLGIFLPVLGILSATQEWSQRTAMTTFALEPRRGRVVAAKIASTVLLGLGAVVVTLALGAVGRLLGDLRGAETPWGVDGWMIAGLTLMMTLYVLQGLAFGLAFLSTPAAIVAYFALPTLLPLMSLVSWLATPYEWIDLTMTTAPLTTGEALTGEQWGQLAVSVALWIGVPLVIGVWRVLRREVK